LANQATNRGILIRKVFEMADKSEKVTDKQVYLNRRLFIQTAALAGTAAASTLLYRRLNPPPAEPVKGEKLQEVAKAPQEEQVKQGFAIADQLTPLDAITNYNNFYEFDTS